MSLTGTPGILGFRDFPPGGVWWNLVVCIWDGSLETYGTKENKVAWVVFGFVNEDFKARTLSASINATSLGS